ncbi:MAG: FAD-dependent oxidoreductase [Gammaproteobacteria bacterium]|nr:FAD-dependent oxidoreductase [Gammaproteobacteria bacterium]
MSHQVVIVGAGAAGIAAARCLLAEGVQIRVMEAAAVPGGRCITDTTSLGHPFDRGGSWIHSAGINPMADLARQQGAAIIEDDPGGLRAVVVGEQRLSDDAFKAYVRDWRRLADGRDRAPAAAGDPAMGTFVPGEPWGPYVRHVVALLSGVDAGACSSEDFSRFEHAPGEWLLPRGQGSLLAAAAEGLPIVYENPVHRIDSRRDPIRIQTRRGEVEADAVIVTVSTAVLAAGTLTFDPELPGHMRDAISGLPLGLLNKVGMAVREDSPLAAPGAVLMHHGSADEAVMIRPGFANQPVVCSFVGGSFADALEREGVGAATEACMEALRAHYGGAITRDLGPGLETAWRSHPWSLGAYSAALPGHSDARSVLASGVDERLLFAGEATDTTLFSSVGGAWRSGIRAAEQCLKAMGQARPPDGNPHPGLRSGAGEPES